MEEFGTPWFDRSNEQFNRFQILAPPFQASGAGKGLVLFRLFRLAGVGGCNTLRTQLI
jgi:hypothetical protein